MTLVNVIRYACWEKLVHFEKFSAFTFIIYKKPPTVIYMTSKYRTSMKTGIRSLRCAMNLLWNCWNAKVSLRAVIRNFSSVETISHYSNFIHSLIGIFIRFIQKENAIRMTLTFLRNIDLNRRFLQLEVHLCCNTFILISFSLK